MAMYLNSLTQRIEELTTQVKVKPQQYLQSCQKCKGTGQIELSEEERQKFFGMFSGMMQRNPELFCHTQCDCENPEYLKYQNNVNDLRLYKKIYADMNLPLKYQTMCFGNFKGTIPERIYKFCNQLQFNDNQGHEYYGFIFSGSVGAGKTHLAVSALNAVAIQHKIKCVYKNVVEIFMELKESYNKENFSEGEVLKKYMDVPVLLLDDIGIEKDNNWMTEILYTIINYRYVNNKMLIATTNISINDLKDKIGVASVSRLMALGMVVNLQGEDWRSK